MSEYPEDDVEIGEEFESQGYIWVKLDNGDKALVWDCNTHDWKKPIKLTS